jgi:hypothetical protein
MAHMLGCCKGRYSRSCSHVRCMDVLNGLQLHTLHCMMVQAELLYTNILTDISQGSGRLGNLSCSLVCCTWWWVTPYHDVGAVFPMRDSTDPHSALSGLLQGYSRLLWAHIHTPLMHFCSYRDSYFSQGLARVQEFLDGSAGDSSSCLICLSAISPTDAVWSCQQSCYALYHLNCAQVCGSYQGWTRVLVALPGVMYDCLKFCSDGEGL